MGILSMLLWTPAVGVLLLVVTPGQHTHIIRCIANLFTTVAFFLACSLVIRLYDQHNAGMQFYEYFPLNIKLGSAYALGIDGLSLPMLVLATLLTSIALLASFSISSRVKGYYICILLLEFGVLGVFLAQDWALFYIFWEVTLIPLFFLIDRWGGKRRHAASLNFVLYTMGGSIFMLISLVAVYEYVPEHVSLMSAMSQVSENMPKNQQVLALLGFLIGFGVKMPIFPLHGWLPLAHVEAPSPVSILLSGILLKMGAYGLLRVVVMLPGAAQTLQPLLVFLALFGMLYGGLLAWRQSDLKAMVAYSSVSHMGIVLLGIATLNEAGITGAVIQMVAHGLIAGALFLLVGLLYERTHTRNIQDYSSLVQVMPRFALFTTLTLLAAMGLPGSVGFIAELHAIIGGFQQWGGLMVFFSASILISAAYAMRTIGLLFTGPVKPQMQHIEDLKTSELLAAGILVAGIVLLGLMPAPLIDLSAATVTQMNSLIGQRIL
ncbi:MAG: NADH-quinone oxidoreductase subunit M [Methylobacter sp.]|jgi:NADH-quinone oxidoreductase subunit M